MNQKSITEVDKLKNTKTKLMKHKLLFYYIKETNSYIKKIIIDPDAFSL